MNPTEAINPKVDHILEDQIGQIWAYVREHRDSLDSERGRKMIRVACERAVEKVDAMLTEVSARLEVVTKRKADLKAELKESHSLTGELQAKLVAAEAKAQEQQDALEAAKRENAALQQQVESLSRKKKKTAEVAPPAEPTPVSDQEPLIAKA